MCFHTKQTKDADALEKRFQAKVNRLELMESTKNYHGFTHPKTPVICNSDDSLIQYYHWGLVPFWANNDSIKKYTLNAKLETLNEKPVFKPLLRRRCLIIADGYYEWKWLDPKGKRKQKYLITLPDNELFVFGGLWSKWIDKASGDVRNTYTIVTTVANDQLCEIHNSRKRMPLILSEENEKAWLNNEPFESFIKVDIALKAVGF